MHAMLTSSDTAFKQKISDNMFMITLFLVIRSLFEASTDLSHKISV